MRDLRFHTGLLAGTATLLLSLGAPAHADTLREALSQAYETNPLLQSARARQRGTDETVPIERAAGLPSVTSDTTYTEFVKKSANSFTSPDRVLSAQFQLGVPIYSGGAVKNAVKAAKTRVEAGQAGTVDRNGSFHVVVTDVGEHDGLRSGVDVDERVAAIRSGERGRGGAGHTDANAFEGAAGVGVGHATAHGARGLGKKRRGGAEREKE